MGTVFRARHRTTGEVGAAKVINADLAGRRVYRARFARERRVLEALDHPNIVPILDAGEEGDVPFIVTAFAPNGDVSALLRGELTTATVLSILRQSAEGLAAAHGAGIVHRDVKPGNLLVKDDGGQLRILVADFGIAWGRDFATSYTPYGCGVGTPGYMSPECSRGDRADARADVYSLACCLALLVGREGRRGPIARVIAKATSYYPEHRHPDVMTLCEDAEKILRSAGERALTPTGGGLEETRLDTPAGGTLPGEDLPSAAIVEAALERCGLPETACSSCLARGRSDTQMVTALITVVDVDRMRRHVNALAADLADELGVERVRIVVLPAELALADLVRSYLGLIFAQDVPAEDRDLVDARRQGNLLEIDLPSTLNRLCDEDALVPLVAHLGVARIRLNPI